MTSNAPIVTRFAPSPTGFLHIGGVRTALFNYLLAKRHSGKFLLRIEDTDLKRSTPEAMAAIVEGMDWLGLKADGDIVYQSKNIEYHIESAMALLGNGNAYMCFLSDEEQTALKDKAREDGVAFRSPWRDRSPDDYPNDGNNPPVIRFKVPDGTTTITDHVQGEVKWDNAQFDDLILLRSDQTPTYMLAVVVDDHNMGVTHIIRGDDHLINAGRQSLIYRAMGWDVPEFAHVPLIHGPDGKKLSKRHGALGIEAYRDMGYIQSGLKNYLLKLGWAKGDEEIFTDESAIAAFDLSGINQSPARLDFDKMAFINGQHIQMSDDDFILSAATPFLEQQNPQGLTDKTLAKVRAAMPELKTRSKTLIELAEQAKYLTATRPIELNKKARKALKAEAISRLIDLQNLLKSVQSTDWNAPHIQTVISDYAQREDIGFGKVGMPLRAALTGGLPSPDLAIVLERLGKDETLNRLNDVLHSQPSE